PGEGALGAGLAEHVVLLGRQALLPLGVAEDELLTDGGRARRAGGLLGGGRGCGPDRLSAMRRTGGQEGQDGGELAHALAYGPARAPVTPSPLSSSTMRWGP